MHNPPRPQPAPPPPPAPLGGEEGQTGLTPEAPGALGPGSSRRAGLEPREAGRPDTKQPKGAGRGPDWEQSPEPKGAERHRSGPSWSWGPHLGDVRPRDPAQAAVVAQVLPARQRLVQRVLLRTVAHAHAGRPCREQRHVLPAESGGQRAPHRTDRAGPGPARRHRGLSQEELAAGGLRPERHLHSDSAATAACVTGNVCERRAGGRCLPTKAAHRTPSSSVTRLSLGVRF